jgi:nitrate/nitrite-specific signal transduction histidine kinase
MLEAACLHCHSTPANAPADLVRQYGGERSFNRSIGDIVSAISIRVPLSAAYAETNRISLLISGVLLFALALLYAFQFIINRRLLFGPLNHIRDKAEHILTDERYLGEVIDISSGKELQDMIAAFNTMSVNLRHGRDHLEENVRERTRELQTALDNVKTLRGMLPICASCKKIRNDDGYWS